MIFQHNKNEGHRLTLYTSNQPKYLHYFVHLKQLFYCDMQDWYQVWNVARILRRLYSKQCWLGNECYDKLLPSAFSFFFPFPQIITITFNSQAKLSSSSRFSDCKLKFCTLKAIYLNTQGNGPPQEHHLKHFFILFFCHNDHKSIKRLFFWTHALKAGI